MGGRAFRSTHFLKFVQTFYKCLLVGPRTFRHPLVCVWLYVCFKAMVNNQASQNHSESIVIANFHIILCQSNLHLLVKSNLYETNKIHALFNNNDNMTVS